jgi:hypothetical protein
MVGILNQIRGSGEGDETMTLDDSDERQKEL